MARARRTALLLLWYLAVALAAFAATEHRGQVTFNGLSVPGATVVAVQSGKTFTTTTDADGFYIFANLDDAPCTIEVRMSGFAKQARDIAIAQNAPLTKWDLKLLPLEEMGAETRAATASETTAASAKPAALAAESSGPVAAAQKGDRTPMPGGAQASQPSDDDEFAQRAADGLLISGSQNNGAASPFGQSGAFGNNRFGSRRLYNGGIGFVVGNSALDAAPYSLAGQNATKPGYDRVTGTFTFGGPLRLGKLFRMPPNFFVGYQWTRNANALTQSAIVPTAAERAGILTSPIIDPQTGAPFPANTIPASRLSPQALALLQHYPLPNVSSGSRYNYQAPVLTSVHQDALQLRWNKFVSRNDQVNGSFALQSVRSSSNNIFQFVDTSSALGMNAGVNWSHRLTPDWLLFAGYQFSRMATQVQPYFANLTNVSGLAGINGNDQTAQNWGPPSLAFADGIASLADAQSSADRNQTSGVSYSMQWIHRGHNVTFGGDYRRRQFNTLAQQNARGGFTFTGSRTGSAFGDFLLGIPDAVSIAYGNADKYFRQSLYDAFFVDDWRVNASVTLNLGLRWDYGSPMTELHDRLVNLDVAKGFAAASAVTATNPAGATTGRKYPTSLMEPDRTAFQPRIGVAWRPRPASSLIVRAGYGLYYDTSVYQVLAGQMAQQPPFSRTLSFENTPALGWTMANAFTAAATSPVNTFAIDPNYRVGRAHTWQVSVQQNLPAALQLVATYSGIRGTHGLQAILPNTYALGGANPCPACPSGFVYLSSTGSSSRDAGQVQLRRRLRAGLAGTLQYTYSKSVDDMAAFGGLAAPSSASNQPMANMSGMPALAIAQDWQNARAERGRSPFDQRHAFSVQVQYTSGTGLHGGAFAGGWTGALLKQWTVSSQITVGSGLPQTPVYLAPVPGTAFTGVLRPDSTGAPLYAAPAGLFLNPAAYAPPAAGQWGNAARSSIEGPATLQMNSSLTRTFQVKDRYSLDFRIDASNLLNHVTYRAWNTVVNSANFGLPSAANAMRSVQTSVRLRF